MPFVANTPESMLGRSDSRNPSSTCVGLTSNGRACRRPVSPTGKKGPLDRTKERSYCFQHREQALRPSHSTPGPSRPTILEEGEERDSIDTLADRMGLVDLNADGRRPGKSSGGSTLSRITCCFCFSFDLGDGEQRPPSPRPQPRPVQGGRTSVPTPHSAPGGVGGGAAAKHLRFIQPTTDPDTSAALIKELSRPFVGSEEPGYIYMFWMTPDTKSNAPGDAARSLLSPPSSSTRDRRPSDVVSSFADRSASSSRKSNTMLLKIGRAANVQRRMNQWQRQCGYDIEVLRFYPWVPSSSASSADAQPRMTEHCHRVERLIHLELAGLGLKVDAAECQACGKEHREWFEAEASREGVRVVDEVIRRWISWDESLGQTRRRRD